MDVVTAFLSPDVEEKIYIQVPEDVELRDEFKTASPALRLLTQLYGVKQAPKLWHDAVHATLHRLNFTRCDSDPCLHVWKTSEFVIISPNVDDVIITSN